MALPSYEDLMRPVLALHCDGREYRPAEIRDAMAAEFVLTDADRRLTMSDGRTPLWRNRVHWAVTYLAQAGALNRPRRGASRITERGVELLRRCPQRIGKAELEQFPEFIEFLNRSRTRSRAREPQGQIGGAAPGGVPSADGEPATPHVDEPIAAATPQETMDVAFQQVRAALASELIERIKAQLPEFFEQLVLDVLTAMGYGGSRADAAERLGRSGDGGIDGVIRQDALGLDVIYVQAKRWEGSVGRPVIQAFVGALHGAHADKGVLITTSGFTPDAAQYARDVPARIILVDGERLARLMIDYGVAVTETTRYELKRIDGDYFPEADADGPPTADAP